MSPLRLTRFDDVGEFEARARSHLMAAEAEHNLILGLCTALERMPELFARAPYLAVVEDGERIVAAALRTPPHNVVLSLVDDPAAVDLIAEDAIDTDDELTGVLGPPDAARRLAELFTARTGRGHRLAVSERIFRLRRVIPPAPVGGSMRIAEAHDRDLLIEWLIAFLREAFGPDEDVSEAATFADRWIARRGRTMYLWDDDEGRPVSMVGAGGETPNGIRIGPVYTPPELRRRGYASALTAAVSQAQLEAGKRFCFLFTDLANPTSNKIYRAIGYEPVIDVDQYRFEGEG